MLEHDDRDDIADAVRLLSPWFHNLRLGRVQTAPAHPLGDFPSAFYRRFENALPRDLNGWSVLDVGCNAGFYSLEMCRRGASRVVGVDVDERYLAQARLAADYLGYRIEFRRQSVYDLRDVESFDLVLFMGVLYHLRHPLLALDILRRCVRQMLVCQTMVRGARVDYPSQPDYPFDDERPFGDDAFPKMHFIEHAYAGDSTNWWIPNASCLDAMLRSAGFVIQERPDTGVCVCTPGAPAPPLPWEPFHA